VARRRARPRMGPVGVCMVGRRSMMICHPGLYWLAGLAPGHSVVVVFLVYYYLGIQ